MEATQLFTVLDTVDSTNNYAMGQVHAGLARHGAGWFARAQTAGRGQRGKSWVAGPGLNIALSVALQPALVSIQQPFVLSAAVAAICFDFFNGYAGAGTAIKWPNDIYFGDRKAGGILIENVFQGSEWKWAVAGMGININQMAFNDHLKNAVSLQQISGRAYDVEQLAAALHASFIEKLADARFMQKESLLDHYNTHLYKRNQQVRLKKENMVFETCIKGVSPLGQLLTEDVVERSFDFGSVEWLL